MNKYTYTYESVQLETGWNVHMILRTRKEGIGYYTEVCEVL